jgi:asparagine synthase (glutamine-hydrolysing)
LRKLLRTDFDWSSIFAKHRQILQDHPGADNLQAMMNLDLQTFLPNLNLMYTDKMSSAVAVEVRVPFLDHLLIETVATIPSQFKLRNGTRKYILKRTAEQYLPPEIVWRRKAGFGAPVGAWLKGQAREMMFDLLSEGTLKRRGYFDCSYVSSLIHDHLEGREYNANQLWQLMVFELWHQEFMDARQVRSGSYEYATA